MRSVDDNSAAWRAQQGFVATPSFHTNPPRTADDDEPAGCGRFIWIGSCVGIVFVLPVVVIFAGLASFFRSSGGAGGVSDSIRGLLAFFVPVTIICLLALFIVCFDRRVFQPAFKLGAVSKPEGGRGHLPPPSASTAAAGNGIQGRCKSHFAGRGLASICVEDISLWIARGLLVVASLLTLLGNNGTLQRASSVDAPTEELPPIEFIGRAGSGVGLTFLWVWVVAEALFHLCLLAIWAYRRCRPAVPAGSARGGSSSTGPGTQARGSATAASGPISSGSASASTGSMLPMEIEPAAASKPAGGSGSVTAAAATGLAWTANGGSFSFSHPASGAAGAATGHAGIASRHDDPCGTCFGAAPDGTLRTRLRWLFPGRCCNWLPCPCRWGSVAPWCCGSSFPQSAALIIVALIFGLSVAGLALGLALPSVRRVTVPLARFPAAMSGFRLGVISDTHIGSATGRMRMQHAVETVLSAKPHAVLLSGDIMDQDEAFYFPAWEGPLRMLSAACNASSPATAAASAAMLANGPAASDACLGVFYSTGNHEPDLGTVQGKVNMLLSYGVRVLTNERVSLPADPAAAPGSPPHPRSFDLVGVPDYATSGRATTQYVTPTRLANESGADMQLAVAGRDPTRELVVMAHQPKHATAAASVGAGLMISGHTHGGQLVPVVFLSGVANDGLVADLYEWKRTATDSSNPQALRVYVNRGTYQYGLPFRHIPNEVTLITLVRA